MHFKRSKIIFNLANEDILVEPNKETSINLNGRIEFC